MYWSETHLIDGLGGSMLPTFMELPSVFRPFEDGYRKQGNGVKPRQFEWKMHDREDNWHDFSYLHYQIIRTHDKYCQNSGSTKRTWDPL